MVERPKFVLSGIRRTLLSCGLLAAGIGWLHPAGPAFANTQLDQAKELLRQTEDEWRREDKAYREAQQAGRLKAREQTEYAEFVAGLKVRLLEQCEAVRAIGGNAAVSEFECIRLSAPPRPIKLPDVSAVQTDEEKKAAMVAKLSDLEGKIDEALMKRQQEMKQEAAASATNASAGGGSSGSASGGASGGAAGSGQEAEATQGGQRSPQGSQSSGGSSSSGRSGSQGAAIPNTGNPSGRAPPPTAGGPSDGQRGISQGRGDGGVDDDVVARQLREAAEKESDPTLKEKLWAEYRKYKGAKQ